MNDLVSATVALSEPDVEGIVVGSLVAYPEALAAVASDLTAEMFADPATRMFIEAILRLHRDGHRISPAVLVAAVSPAVEAAGATRAQAIAHMTASAMPLAHLSGYLSTLRDRAARRQLAALSNNLREDAVALDADPHETAALAVATLDEITAARQRPAAGSLADSTDALFEALAQPDGGRGATTGLRSLDVKLNGYMRGKLYVVAGRPGMGKSAFMCSSLRRTAAAGHGVLIFSLEMGREEVAARCASDWLSSLEAPTFGDILRNQFSEADGDQLIRAREAFGSIPLRIDATPALRFSEIVARARRFKASLEAKGKRLDVVCVDHMGLVTPSDRYSGNKVAEAGEVSGGAKRLAKELDCCVLLLCQLNRGVEGREDKRPSLADLRWSGDIEQDADVVGFLFRPAYYLAQRPDADPAEVDRERFRLELLLRKNRNGPPDDVPMWCSIAHSSIKDLHS